jgi:hypothetical protein
MTEVDPARMDLLLERFVTKERHEPPDIDFELPRHQLHAVPHPDNLTRAGALALQRSVLPSTGSWSRLVVRKMRNCLLPTLFLTSGP